MKFRTIPTVLTLALCVFAAACSQEFNDEAIRIRAAARPFQIDNEQVSLNGPQMGCGVDNELWEGTPPVENHPTVYRLTEKGRALQFSDDIYVNEPGYPAPFTQVRGKFSLQIDRVVTVDDASDGSKRVQAVVSVKIPHPCFSTPLPLMGIKKGKFSAEIPPTLKYENSEDGWWPTQLVH